MMSNESLRSIGLSASKISYLKNIAEFVETKGLNCDEMQQLENEVVLKILAGIKGIGPWTAQNFLMMALGREDVFSPDDLILQNVISELYGLKKENKKDFKKKIL
ncbi:DNA-3-methyladenine glycosylase family protein [Chryseobacterium tagetis]|nr:hypothetical protein [Chryseobacterium tagetis]